MKIRWALIALALSMLARPTAARADGEADLSKPPRLLRFEEAVAPAALESRKNAAVLLAIDIDATGTVQNVEVLEPAGDGFDEAAVAAVKMFEFEPGEAEGQKVPVRITYRYRFFLKPAPEQSTTATAAENTTPTAPFSGRVLLKGERTPLDDVEVVLDDGAQSTRTARGGIFSFARVPLGSHAIVLRSSQIASADAKIELHAGKQLDVTYYVEGKQRYASTVRSRHVAEQVVQETLTAEEVRRIPGTQGDTLKSVQNLPGVARPPFGGGLLVVWGSSPQDTRTYIDGVFVPTLYHFGGVRSTFNSELVDSLTFQPGGYGAEFGRGLGGVIQVESKAPRTDAPHGFLQIDLIDGTAMFDGPLTKNLSLAVGVRRSWVDQYLSSVLSSKLQLSPVYYDYQAHLRWNASQRDDVDVLFFGSDDVLSLRMDKENAAHSAEVDSHTYYHRGVARWRHRFDGGATSDAMFSLGYDVPFQFELKQDGVTRETALRTFGYTFREALDLPMTSWLKLHAGLDFEGNVWPIDMTLGKMGPPRDGDPFNYFGVGVGGGLNDTSNVVHDEYTLYMNNVAPYLGATFTALDGRLTIQPQLRLELMTFASGKSQGGDFSSSSVALEPRVAAKYQLLPWLTPKLAFGIYHQPPAPLDFSRSFGNPSLKPETALQYVAGFDIDPMKGLHIEVEGFYKDLRNLIVRGDGSGDLPLVNEGIGRVYGGELLLRHQLSDNFFGWVSYTLSRSERRDHADAAWRAFEYDQTHILTLVASYKFKFWKDFQAGLRFRYVTGSLFTPVIDAEPNSGGGFDPTYGRIYSDRVGGFHQLDFRLDKTFVFNTWKLSLYLDFQNLYNRPNPEGLRYNDDYTQSQTLSGLPFLPVLGIRGEF